MRNECAIQIMLVKPFSWVTTLRVKVWCQKQLWENFTLVCEKESQVKFESTLGDFANEKVLAVTGACYHHNLSNTPGASYATSRWKVAHSSQCSPIPIGQRGASAALWVVTSWLNTHVQTRYRWTACPKKGLSPLTGSHWQVALIVGTGCIQCISFDECFRLRQHTYRHRNRTFLTVAEQVISVEQTFWEGECRLH